MNLVTDAAAQDLLLDLTIELGAPSVEDGVYSFDAGAFGVDVELDPVDGTIAQVVVLREELRSYPAHNLDAILRAGRIG